MDRIPVGRRWVVKVGSALITNDGRGLDSGVIETWVAQMVALRSQGVDVVLVSSGSVAEGMSRLGLVQRPDALYELQSVAAIGQMGLVASLRIILPASCDPHRPGAAHPRGLLGPRAVPERAQHPSPTSALRCRSRDQRERRNRDAGDPARRQ